MRGFIAASIVAAVALFAAVPAGAEGGHWYCTADGIKSWTTGSAADAKGWSFVGDRGTYKSDGHCAKAS